MSGSRDWVFCPHCGQTGFFVGQSPHGDNPCPLKLEEHEKQMELLDARIESTRVTMLTARERAAS